MAFGLRKVVAAVSGGCPFLQQMLRERLLYRAHGPVGEHDGIRRNAVKRQRAALEGDPFPFITISDGTVSVLAAPMAFSAGALMASWGRPN
jgi:hypothetical protein